MLCALGFDMFYNFLKGELQGKKNQDLGKLPTEMEGKLVVMAEPSCFLKCASSLPCFPISSSSTPHPRAEFQLDIAEGLGLMGSSPVGCGFLSNGLAGRWKQGRRT